MGNNQIICGEAASILSGLEEGCVDLVVTDPPYLCNYRDRYGRTVRNDTNAKAILDVFDEVYRVLKPDSYCIGFYGWNAVAEFAPKWKALGVRRVGHFW